MDIEKKANELLRESEHRMRELVGEAASAGDYEATVRLTSFARALNELLVSHKAQPDCEAYKTQTSVKNDSKSNGITSRLQSKTKRVDRRKSKGVLKKKYPVFYRMRDMLIKIGWSKREKAEYEHKAPRRVVELLATILVQKGMNGNLVTSEDFLPLIDPVDGSEVPSYQAYLSLLWMRQCGLVKQRGRQGYLVEHSREMKLLVDEAWQRMQTGS